MATLHGILSVRLQDFLGIKGTHTMYFQVADSTTLAGVVTAVNDYMLELDPLTDAMGLRARFELLLPATGMKTSVTVKNRLENGGLFTFQQSNINKAYSMVIPAFAEAQIVNGKIDLSSGQPPDLWIQRIKTAPGSTVLPTESNVENLLPIFSSCRLNDRKYRKSDTRVTSEVP